MPKRVNPTDSDAGQPEVATSSSSSGGSDDISDMVIPVAKRLRSNKGLGSDDNNLVTDNNDGDGDIPPVIASVSTRPFDLLPNELVEKVFANLNKKNLAKLCLVSKRFRDIARLPSLWTWLSHEVKWDKLTAARISDLFEGQWSLLKELYLPSSVSVSTAIEALNKCEKLEELEVNFGIGRGWLLLLLKAVGSATNLKRLLVEGRWADKDVLVNNADCLANLTELSFERGLNDQGLVSIGRHCRSLRALRFQSDHRPNDEDGHVRGHGFRLFLQSVKDTLEELCITNSDTFLCKSNFMGLSECHRLTILNLDYSILEHGIMECVANVPQLTILSISLFPNDDEIDIDEDNDPGSIPTAELISAFTKMSKLTDLDLAGQKNVNDDVLITIARNCPDLVVLNVCHTSRKVTHAGLGNVLEKCNKLEELKVVEAENIKADVLKEMKPNLMITG